jgi:hypothetical protein
MHVKYVGLAPSVTVVDLEPSVNAVGLAPSVNILSSHGAWCECSMPSA